MEENTTGEKLVNDLQQAVSEFQATRQHASFSARHPELGKMINCGICGRRHRFARTCLASYTKTMKVNGVEQPYEGVKNEEGVNLGRVAIGWGRGKGRILKHRNVRSLQILERAAKIYNEDLPSLFNPTKEELDKLGKRSLSRAMNEIRKERAERRRALLKITIRSRRINRAA